MHDDGRPLPPSTFDLDKLQRYGEMTACGPTPCGREEVLFLVGRARRTQALEELVVALMQHMPPSVTVTLPERHLAVLDGLWPARTAQVCPPFAEGGVFDMTGGNGERIRIADTGAQIEQALAAGRKGARS